MITNVGGDASHGSHKAVAPMAGELISLKTWSNSTLRVHLGLQHMRVRQRVERVHLRRLILDISQLNLPYGTEN